MTIDPQIFISADLNRGERTDEPVFNDLGHVEEQRHESGQRRDDRAEHQSHDGHDERRAQPTLRRNRKKIIVPTK